MSDMPVVCVFGASRDVRLVSDGVPPFEAKGMGCRCYPDDSRLMEVLAKDRPGAVVSVGKLGDFRNLNAAPFCVRRMWLHFGSEKELEGRAAEVYQCFFHGAVAERAGAPLVSVFTPTYRTGSKLSRPWDSLLAQTYADWEWVVMDDSDDGGATFEALSALADKDCRVRAYKGSRRSGRIGDVKRSACGLARGKLLLELDHDDELVPEALELVVRAFEDVPEAGFVYTDCAECFEDGTPVEYKAGWGMGYGSYREETRGGVRYKVINSPNVNPKTVRHIVAAPNHIRAWRKEVYDGIGGHKGMLHVADDYELLVRTFLATRMCRVPRFCYVQYRNSDGNASVGERNMDIQRLVRSISTYYDGAIHRRLVELGVDDYVWKEGEETFWRTQKVPSPATEQHCTLTWQPKD